MKKIIWKKLNKHGKEGFVEINLSSNRIALSFIREHFRNKWISPTNLMEGLNISRNRARHILRNLYKSYYLNTKRVSKMKIKDSRIYKINKKGLTQMPKRKGEKKEVIREVIKEVPIQEKYSDTVRPVRRI